MERVSIIIPVYNLEKEIERCLDSVLRQTYQELEILIMDDGSEDGSLPVCQRIAERDQRVHVFSLQHHGASYARNRGIEKASGKYIMFIDGDDEIAPDMIESYVSAFSGVCDAVIGGITIREPGGKTIVKQPCIGSFSRRDFIDHVCRETSGIYGYVSCKLYAADRIRSNHIFFNERLQVQEDLDFALSVYRAATGMTGIANTGYCYWHKKSNREIPTAVLIANQMKLYDIASEAGCDACKAVVRKIQSLVYTAAYWAPEAEDIEKLLKIPGIRDCLKKERPVSLEKRVILFLLIHDHANLVCRYFKVRSKVLFRRGKRRKQ